MKIYKAYNFTKLFSYMNIKFKIKLFQYYLDFI